MRRTPLRSGRALAWLGAALAVVGCGAGGARDASRDTDADATGDAAFRPDAGVADAGRPDANLCPVWPPAPPAGYVADLIYDRKFEDSPLGGEPYDVGAWRVFADGDGIAVFSRDSVYRADFDGAIVSRAPYPVIDGSRGYPGHFAQGASGFGGSMQFLDASIRFCAFSADGTADASRCAVVSPSPPPWATVAWDGDRYLAATTVWADMTLKVFAFDSGGTLLGETDVSTDLPGLSGAFVETAGSSVVSTYAAGHLPVGDDPGGCASYLLDVFDSSLTRQIAAPIDLLPADQRRNGLFVASSDTRTAILMYGICRAGDTESCGSPSNPQAAFLAIVEEGGAITVPTHIVPFAGADKLHWDGERFALVGSGSGPTESLAMTWFGEDGTWLAHRVDLPLDYTNPGHELLGNVDFAAVGPNDYVIVYGMSQPWGEETRIARFRLVPAAWMGLRTVGRLGGAKTVRDLFDWGWGIRATHQ